MYIYKYLNMYIYIYIMTYIVKCTHYMNYVLSYFYVIVYAHLCGDS
jgi:hypothetical protein